VTTECSIEGCTQPAKTRGWCNKHYLRWWTHGDPHAVQQRERGTGMMLRGYLHVRIPEHPLANARGYVPEHRRVAWDAGLFDDPSLVVHHVDGDPTNNALNNLCPMTVSEHVALHHQEETS